MILSLALYFLVMTVTPGPNNMLLTASGARFGYKKTFPLLLGIVLGMVSLITFTSLGLGYLFERFPVLQKVLKITGSAYILYLAYKVAVSAGGPKSTGEEDAARPMTLLNGILFQYANPKAYLMSITAVSVYNLNPIQTVLIFICIAPFCISLWALFGTVLGRLLGTGRSGRPISMALGGVTAASVLFIWI